MAFDWPNPDEIDGLTPHQQGALRTAFRTRLCCLEGPPGSGKSWVARAVIAHLRKHRGFATVAGAAPTGKAAVRLQSYLEDAGVNVWTGTQHRLLGVQRNGHGDGDWDFQYRRGRPLPVNYLFLDEQSMCDTPLMSQTLEAIRDGACVMLIGDAHQLPPVGHGQPFKNLLGSDRFLGVGRLTEIHRNSGEIVWVCKQIRDEQRYDPPKLIDAELGLNLAHVETRTSGQSLARVKQIIDGFRGNAEGLNIVTDIQVVVARNKSGEVSRERINQELQEYLNPDGERIEGVQFRVGDKVICTKNGFYKDLEIVNGKAADAGPVFVSNGDTGLVKHVAKKLVVVQFQAPARLVEVPARDGPLDLAYAVTCHKMQGSQSPVVIIAADEGDRNVCSRQWWYTAISRAKDYCYVVGKKSVVQQQVRREQAEFRKTFLFERIRGLHEAAAQGEADGTYRTQHRLGVYTGD